MNDWISQYLSINGCSSIRSKCVLSNDMQAKDSTIVKIIEPYLFDSWAFSEVKLVSKIVYILHKIKFGSCDWFNYDGNW